MRTKNQLEKDFGPMNFNKLLALTYGRNAGTWGLDVIQTVARITILLKSFSDFPNRPLAQKFKRSGWQMFLRPRCKSNPENTLQDGAHDGILKLLEVVENAWRTRDATLLRQTADALETVNQPDHRDASPVDDYLVSFMQGSTKRGFRQIRFETAAEVHRRFPGITRKTIHNRADALGVVLKKGRRGAPPGPRKLLHRARR